MLFLVDAGWSCEGFVKYGRHARPDSYSDASPKMFWVKPHQVTLSPSYLRALLLNNEHKQTVDHFRAEGYYIAVIEGRPCLIVSK